MTAEQPVPGNVMPADAGSPPLLFSIAFGPAWVDFLFANASAAINPSYSTGFGLSGGQVFGGDKQCAGDAAECVQ